MMPFAAVPESVIGPFTDISKRRPNAVQAFTLGPPSLAGVSSPGRPSSRVDGGSAAECWVDRPLHAKEALAFQPLRPENSHAHRQPRRRSATRYSGLAPRYP